MSMFQRRLLYSFNDNFTYAIYVIIICKYISTSQCLPVNIIETNFLLEREFNNVKK